jgi:uncharacterized protein YecT (DUF1311 family)
MRGAIITVFAGIAALLISSLRVEAQTTDLVPRRGDDQPSFDCATAKTAAARLICADAELARLDRELGAAFQKEKLQVFSSDQSKFVADEISWIRERNARCGLVGKSDLVIEALASSKPCLLAAIRERVAFLAGPEQRPSSNESSPPDGSAPPKRFEGSPNNLYLPTPPAPPASSQTLSQVDPQRQWCIEHTNPATCSPIQSCIDFCIQNSVRHDPAAMAKQLEAEHEAKRRQQEEQVAVAGKFELAKQEGYRPVSFDDFKLDGKTLAGANAKLILRGFYSKSGDLEIMQPTGLAVATARQYGNDSGIPVLSEDAARNVRKYFLECSNNPLAQLGCPVTVSGHATMCSVTSLLGSKSVPCLVVEDGW